MKRTLTLNLFLLFVLWGTFKSTESLLRTAGAQEVYTFYGLEWLYFIVVAFGALGGLALAYAIWRAKPWGYVLGFVWLGVGVANSIFNGAVAYLNKPLMTEILTATAESRGRDTTSIEAFVNSSMYAVSMVGSSVLVVVIMFFFMWHLYRRRGYFSVTE